MPLQTELVSGELQLALTIANAEQTRDRIRSRKMRKVRHQQVLAAAGSGGSDLFSEKSFANQTEGNEEFMEAFSYESFLERPEKADRDRSGSLDIRESIALAFGLTLNNLGAGIGAGISDLSVSFTTLLTFGLSVTAVLIGYKLGRRSLACLSGLTAGVVSGILIVITGVYEYFVL